MWFYCWRVIQTESCMLFHLETDSIAWCCMNKCRGAIRVQLATRPTCWWMLILCGGILDLQLLSEVSRDKLCVVSNACQSVLRCSLESWEMKLWDLKKIKFDFGECFCWKSEFCPDEDLVWFQFVVFRLKIRLAALHGRLLFRVQPISCVFSLITAAGARTGVITPRKHNSELIIP